MVTRMGYVMFMYILIFHKQTKPRLLDVMKQMVKLPNPQIHGSHIESAPMCKPILEIIVPMLKVVKLIINHTILFLPMQRYEIVSD